MKKMVDKVWLVVISFSGIAVVFFMNLLIRKIVSEEWTIFIIGSTAYLVLMLWGALSFKEFKQIPRRTLLFFWSGFYAVTVSSALLVFRHELLPMPKSFHVYIAGIVILLIIGSVVLLELFGKLEKGKEDVSN